LISREVLTASLVKNVQGGIGKIVANIPFVNGAVKWATIDKDRAVLPDIPMGSGLIFGFFS
jgi:hypothetical protein